MLPYLRHLPKRKNQTSSAPENHIHIFSGYYTYAILQTFMGLARQAHNEATEAGWQITMVD
jgi:hypothetical protein